MVRKKKVKEDLELAREHIKLAEDLVEETSADLGEDEQDALKDAAFELEKADSDLEEIEE